MKRILFQIISLSLLIPLCAFSQPAWQKINSAGELCSAYPEKVRYIFENLDLGYMGLEKVKKAYDSGNLTKACDLLLDYYRKSASAKRLHRDQPKISKKTVAEADSALMDIFTFQRVPGHVPRLPDGSLNWSFNGPEDDIEWAWALNRHYPVSNLLSAWFGTGNPEYLVYTDRFIRDWIIRSWPYPEKKSNTAMWRGLEVSFRVKVWALVFYGLMNTPYISPATKLLILSSLPDHAHYARNFHAQNNWLTMEISGLATVATAWPEFRQSQEWLTYAMETMSESMKKQVYPDGAQTELTSSYHIVALKNFELFKKLCEDAGKKLPDFFNTTLEKMYGYLALTIRPDGFGLLNNDADLMNNRKLILSAAADYNRDDWKYIVTNGKEGKSPGEGPSFLLPWAGQVISRSGYDADAQWSFFDIGPWGSGHQHNDKLNVTVAAFGRELLVDCGRFAYRGEVAAKFRKYASGSQSHNVILIDGQSQGPGPLETKNPLPEDRYRLADGFDVASGSFDNFQQIAGRCKHTRTLYYDRGNFWVVVDRIATDRPRKIEALWHWHPDCKVRTRGTDVFSVNDRGNLGIIPAGTRDWNVRIMEGQENPEIQGWYSKEYNSYRPSPAAVYSTQIQSNATFVWLLFPSEKNLPDIHAEIVSETPGEIKILTSGQGIQAREISLPLPADGLNADN